MKNSSGYCVVLLSPPSRWSGLKYEWSYQPPDLLLVSTLAVEWIEIFPPWLPPAAERVSTLAVEWIEID